jgi:hypothetical protein
MSNFEDGLIENIGYMSNHVPYVINDTVLKVRHVPYVLNDTVLKVRNVPYVLTLYHGFKSSKLDMYPMF